MQTENTHDLITDSANFAYTSDYRVAALPFY